MQKSNQCFVAVPRDGEVIRTVPTTAPAASSNIGGAGSSGPFGCTQLFLQRPRAQLLDVSVRAIELLVIELKYAYRYENKSG